MQPCYGSYLQLIIQNRCKKLLFISILQRVEYFHKLTALATVNLRTEGQMIRPNGPSLFVNGKRFSCSKQNMMSGKVKTSVFPEPVNAMPIMSRPDSLKQMFVLLTYYKASMINTLVLIGITIIYELLRCLHAA